VFNFLTKKTQVGIDLGSSSIKIAGFRLKRGVCHLEFIDTIDLVKKYSLEPFQEVADDLYVEQLRELVQKYHLKGTEISVALPAGSGIIQILKVAAAQSESELFDKIRREMRQVTDQSLDDMQIACCELEDKGSEEDKIPLLVCAIPNEIFARYKSIISRAGLKANVFDLDALGVYNAFYYFSEMNFGPTTIVQVSDHYSICLIILPGRPPFFHVIDLGAEHLNEQTAEMTNSKVETSVAAGDDSKWTDLDLLQNLSPLQIHPANFENFSSEVRKCMRHIQTHEGILKFDKIYLSGGGFVLADLAENFEQTFEIETKIWNPILQFTNGGNNELTRNQLESGRYLIPAIGSALRGN